MVVTVITGACHRTIGGQPVHPTPGHGQDHALVDDLCRTPDDEVDMVEMAGPLAASGTPVGSDHGTVK